MNEEFIMGENSVRSQDTIGNMSGSKVSLKQVKGQLFY